MDQGAEPMTMEHRGYTATVRWDEESKCYAGKVMDTWGTIAFHDYTWEKMYQAFKNMLDDYLEHCKEDGEEPRLSVREALAHAAT